MVILLGVSLAGIPVNAQKPVIELLPMDHQHQHPEFMADTFSLGEFGHGEIPIADSSVYGLKTVNPYNKEDGKHRRTLWPFKVFHFKREPDRIRNRSQSEHGRQSENRTLFLKYIHPIQLFFQITALK